VTEVFELPVTVAENCFVVPLCIDAEAGVRVMPIEAGAFTVTIADADLVESATLVALTVYVPALPGAT
jgi:hypothetical protein